MRSRPAAPPRSDARVGASARARRAAGRTAGSRQEPLGEQLQGVARRAGGEVADLRAARRAGRQHRVRRRRPRAAPAAGRARRAARSARSAPCDSRTRPTCRSSRRRAPAGRGRARSAARAAVSSAPNTARSWQCGWTTARPPGAKRSRPAAASSATRPSAGARRRAATAAAASSPGSSRRQSSQTIAWQLGSTKTIGSPAAACGASDGGGRSRRAARLVDHAHRQHRAPAAAGAHDPRRVAGGAQEREQRLADVGLLVFDEAVGEDDHVGGRPTASRARARAGRRRPAPAECRARPRAPLRERAPCDGRRRPARVDARRAAGGRGPQARARAR